MNENLISGTSSERAAYELLRRAEHIQQETLKLNDISEQMNEISHMQEEIRIKKEQAAFVEQQIKYVDQVSDALSSAIAVLSKPTAVPLGERTLLTVKEATAHTGVGQNRLRRIGKSKIGDLALWDGNKLMFKREKLDGYLGKSFSI